MQNFCKQCRLSFEITQDDLAFYDRVSPVFAGKKYTISPPTHCPDCRQQRRIALCNERNFYSANCGLCRKNILTEQPPHNKKVIYCRECWHSDKWDPCTYGRDVDFSRPIFDQLKELWREVPAENLLNEGTNQNSDYIHYAGFAKNCYLIMHADFCEDCYYGYGFKKNTSCVDGFYNLRCELCYDCVDIHSCYGLKGCQDCVNCSSSAFLRDCVGCKNCFLCVGLREKEYCFGNKQLSAGEYKKMMAGIDLGSHAQYQKCKSRRKDIEKNHHFKEFQGQNLENCSGDHLQSCKDTHRSFDCEDVEHGKYLYQIVTGAKDLYDCNQYGLNLRESYECCTAGNNTYHALFSHQVHMNCADISYCWFIHSSKNCFGCVNVHHKQYCIFNKQYTKDQYEALVPKVIDHMQTTGEWGEFFPFTFSPFGYNKSTAYMYYPMKKEDVLKRGWNWDDAPDTPPSVKKTIKSSVLPDSIDDIPDDVLEWAIECEVTGKPFKLTPQELKFYREQRLPLPRRAWQQRHLDRFAQRNPRKFWMRNCAKCAKQIQTTYSPDRKEIVYCEECYLKEVY